MAPRWPPTCTKRWWRCWPSTTGWARSRRGPVSTRWRAGSSTCATSGRRSQARGSPSPTRRRTPAALTAPRATRPACSDPNRCAAGPPRPSASCFPGSGPSWTHPLGREGRRARQGPRRCAAAPVRGATGTARGDTLHSTSSEGGTSAEVTLCSTRSSSNFWVACGRQCQAQGRQRGVRRAEDAHSAANLASRELANEFTALGRGERAVRSAVCASTGRRTSRPQCCPETSCSAETLCGSRPRRPAEPGRTLPRAFVQCSADYFRTFRPSPAPPRKMVGVRALRNG